LSDPTRLQDFSAEAVLPGHRNCTIGLLGVAVVVIVHTETESAIYVISTREAENREIRKFFSYP
jgi:uncharacterized DUF497 family protein